MLKQSELAQRDRGGVPLRDYTRGGKPDLSRLEITNFNGAARRLGLLSLLLGLGDAFFPRRMQRLTGAAGDLTALYRAAGLREILSALLIFGQARPVIGMASRVAGDTLDIVSMAAALRHRRANKRRLALTLAGLSALAAVDGLVAVKVIQAAAEAKGPSVRRREDLNHRTAPGTFRVARSLIINRPAEELYAYWRNFENLPRFMYHLQAVHVLDPRRSHWVAAGPAGATVEWDAMIVTDRMNEAIAWQSLGGDVPNSGEVHFERLPHNRGTLVRVHIDYRPPAGAVGRFVAGLFGREPSMQVKGDLRRFKQIMETGEVTLSDGSPAGFGQKVQRAGQPLSVQETRELPEEVPDAQRQHIRSQVAAGGEEPS